MDRKYLSLRILYYVTVVAISIEESKIPQTMPCLLMSEKTVGFNIMMCLKHSPIRVLIYTKLNVSIYHKHIDIKYLN